MKDFAEALASLMAYDRSACATNTAYYQNLSSPTGSL